MVRGTEAKCRWPGATGPGAIEGGCGMRSETPIRLALTIFMLFLAWCPVSGKVGPDGNVRVFCFGDVIEQYGGFNSYTVIEIDPAIDLTPVPTRPGYLGGAEVAKRNLRIYMPRTYSRLVGGYDLILSSDADSTVFEDEWMNWMAQGVTDGGLGVEWLGSIGRSQSQQNLDWSQTPIAGVLPSYTSPEFYEYGIFRVRIRDPEEELMKALPWEDSPPLANLDMQIPKDGSRVFAVVQHPREWPLITYWDVGNGAGLCFASKFPNGVMPWSDDWPLFQQAMIYLAYRTSGKSLPLDHLLFQELMSSFFEFETGESIVMSVIYFVEEFGGNPNMLYEDLDKVDEIKDRSDREYLSENYAESMRLIADALSRQREIMIRSLRAKDRALLWVYAIEWSAFTATLLASGFALWSLMVKRRLYARVGSSRVGSGLRER
jgi:hypothetical protein